MKNDHEVLRMRRERSNGKTQEQAAARAAMSVRTARHYERLGQLPSQTKQLRTHRTRPNPFAGDWAWVVAQLERDAALQAKTRFAELVQRYPGRYQPNQLRTPQRHVASWRAQFGPAREVMFAQVHHPGARGQSDFTHMEDLQVTLAGLPFAHLVYHFILTYSHVEAIQLCFSGSFEALAEGIESCLWQVGSMPQLHRTDNLSAAVVKIAAAGERVYTDRYLGLRAHDHMQPSTNQPGIAHEHGDVAQAHYRFKEAVDQALRLRGSRDIADRAAYTRWLEQLVRQRNATRAVRWVEERLTLQPLPTTPRDPTQELTVTVSRSTTMRVLRNSYAVPSRLIGQTLLARVRAETIERSLGPSPLMHIPRLRAAPDT